MDIVAALRLFFYDKEVWRGSIRPHVVRHNPVNKNVQQDVPRHLVVVGENGHVPIEFAHRVDAGLLQAPRLELLRARDDPPREI